MSQNSRLLTYLEQHGSITTMESFQALRICRLSERIRELQALGWRFSKLRVSVPHYDGYASVIRYTLISGPSERQGSRPGASSLPAVPPLFLPSDVVESPQTVGEGCQ